MYNSPIEMIIGNMQIQQEGEIFRAVQEIGVNVDKDELLKALQYDRGQYEKGYDDGVEAGIRDFAKFLIDKSENGVICIADIPDLVREMMEGEK
jgi:hypothetical protein